MANAKYEQYTTPKGIAKWPFLTNSDEGKSEYDPAFRVVLEVEKDVMENYVLPNGELLLPVLLDKYNEAKKIANSKDKEPQKPPWKFNDDGNYELKFNIGAYKKDKTTNMLIARTLPIYDAKKNIFRAPTIDGEIGSGSLIRINFSPYVYATRGNYGVTLTLKAVQVIDYVPKGGDYGFSVEVDEDDTSFDVEDF